MLLHTWSIKLDSWQVWALRCEQEKMFPGLSFIGIIFFTLYKTCTLVEIFAAAPKSCWSALGRRGMLGLKNHWQIELSGRDSCSKWRLTVHVCHTKLNATQVVGHSGYIMQWFSIETHLKDMRDNETSKSMKTMRVMTVNWAASNNFIKIYKEQ